jgi:hypothetical protein
MLAETDPAAIAWVVGPDLPQLFYERYGHQRASVAELLALAGELAAGRGW